MKIIEQGNASNAAKQGAASVTSMEEIMINKMTISLIFLLFIVSCASTRQQSNSATVEKDFENHFCGDGTWGVFIGDDQGKPAPNIKLMNLQHHSADDKYGHNITIADIMAINKDVKPAATMAFVNSKAEFEVMVRFTLTPDQPSTVELQYKDAGPSELPHIESFLSKLRELRNYRAKKGTIYVVFHYAIGKAADGPKQPQSTR
jgi:hypothetical protein